MLLATLALGGAILGATTIAGLLMLYQIKTTTDTQNSAKAIFAADSGVEWALFDFYCGLWTPARCTQPPLKPGNDGTLGNGATVWIQCYDASDDTLLSTAGDPSGCNTIVTSTYGISKGTYRDARRAFSAGVTGATSTFP